MSKDFEEALLRIPIGIISGIIFYVWTFLVEVLIIVNWVLTIVTAKRNKELAGFCNIWISAVYDFVRYMTFCTNKRPFPFKKLGRTKDKVE